MKKSWKQFSEFFPLFLFIFLILSLFSFFPNNSKEKEDSYFFVSKKKLALTSSFNSPLKYFNFSLIKNTAFREISPPYLFKPQVLAVKTEKERTTSLSTMSSYKKEIKKYVVKKGDTLCLIAEKFKITPQTIKWANDLKNSLIKPGQELIILPVDGVLHVVKKGDTVTKLAKKYKVAKEDIINFNGLSEDGKLFENEVLIIPGGEKPNDSFSKTSSKPKIRKKGNYYYPWGYCTFWAEYKWQTEQKRKVPSFFGNAKNWLKRAKASGYKVCEGASCPPKKGAIISLKTSHPLGHVAYVEEVTPNYVVFSEMNYYGFGKVNYRRLKIGDKRIRGYIY